MTVDELNALIETMIDKYQLDPCHTNTRKALRELAVLLDTPPDTVAVPVNPPEGLLASMAMRWDHSFGLQDERTRTFMKLQMYQVYEEVVGRGFYQYTKEQQ